MEEFKTTQEMIMHYVHLHRKMWFDIESFVLTPAADGRMFFSIKNQICRRISMPMPRCSCFACELAGQLEKRYLYLLLHEDHFMVFGNYCERLCPFKWGDKKHALLMRVVAKIMQIVHIKKFTETITTE